MHDRIPASETPLGEGHVFGTVDGLVSEEELATLAALADSPGHPRHWSLNEYGQPDWLLEVPADKLRPWGVIIPPRGREPTSSFRVARALDRKVQGLDTWGKGKAPAELGRILEVGPACMPAIPWHTPRPKRRGNPGVARTDNEMVLCAAWLADVRGWGRLEIAERLFVEETGPPLDERALRRKAARYVVAGRQALCDQGLWPWISVPLDRADDVDAEGDLTDGWWEEDDVREYLHVWYRATEADALERERVVRRALEHPGSIDVPAPW